MDDNCLTCDAMLTLIKEYAYKLQKLESNIEYLNNRWTYVTLNNCHRDTCNERYFALKNAENEKYL